MRIFSWGQTDVGMKREANQDNYLLIPDLNVFVVADGMGGHAGGETASRISVETVDEVVRANQDAVDEDMNYTGAIEKDPLAVLLANSVRASCHAVYSESKANPELEGMGTTTVAIAFRNGHAYIAHVGDSRCYMVRNGKILQVTEDHSLVNDQLKAGLITEAQARVSRFKNIITRSVGFTTDVDVDMIVVETKKHDVFLLCSDGLTEHVSDLEIEEMLNENFMHRVPSLLINLANSRGGLDNTTVVCAYVADQDKIEWNADQKSQE